MKTRSSRKAETPTSLKAIATKTAILSCLAASVLTTAHTLALGMVDGSSAIGTSVKQIPWASKLDSWQALDDQRLVVNLDAKHSYLLTLTQHCPRLPSATRIGVSASNNTVYAGFDYITADGRQCGIHKINRINPKQKRWLTKI